MLVARRFPDLFLHNQRDPMNPDDSTHPAPDAQLAELRRRLEEADAEIHRLPCPYE